MGCIKGFFVSWKSHLAREWSCHTFLYLSSSHTVCTNAGRNFLTMFDKLTVLQASYHSKVAPLISELNWKVKNHGTLRWYNIEIDWITDHSICLVKTYTSCQLFHWASLPLVWSGMHDMTLKRVFTISKGETCVSEKREDCFVRLYQQWVYILKV